MNKLLAGILVLTGICFGDIIPVPTFIPDLQHENAILWKVNVGSLLSDAAANGQVLVSADLYIADIKNIFEPEIDALFINLVDVSAGTGISEVIEYDDAAAGTVNFFENTANSDGSWSSAVLMDTYSYDNPWLLPDYYSASLDVSIINSYADNGWIGIALDPDCIYTFNYDLSMLVFTTAPAPVPEPTVLSLLGCGILGLFLLRRKQKK